MKTFAVPKIMYRASVIRISKKLLKEANSILYGFIWNGKDKAKHHTLKCDIEEEEKLNINVEWDKVFSLPFRSNLESNRLS